MASPSGPFPDRLIEKRILALVRRHSHLMFSELAEALHDCTWHRLFAALGRLEQTGRIELTAHRWDYEIRGLAAHDDSAAAPRVEEKGYRHTHERTNI